MLFQYVEKHGNLLYEIIKDKAGSSRKVFYVYGGTEVELREKAKNALGDNFDIKKFHTIVLDQGIVPLFVLEDIIDEWILSY